MNPAQVYQTLRTLGPAALGRRLYYAIKLRTGLLEWLDPNDGFGPAELQAHLLDNTTPCTMLARRGAGQIPFFFAGNRLAELSSALRELVPAEIKKKFSERLDELEKGHLSFFSRWQADLGNPINWQLNPMAKIAWPRNKHWSRLAHFKPELGDIKLVWEASRFSQCFFLTRAFAMGGDERPLRLALRRIDEWIDANPPAIGVQWNCGQETSFRLMAWCFTLHAAYGRELLSESQFAKIAASIYRQALRIERHVGFSRSLKNNHSLSEAVGLYTVGLLFPEFDRASRWRRLGKRILITDACRQIFEDGSYIQHSMNYHRVMLHNCVWAVRLGRLHDDVFPDSFLDRIGKASVFLFQMQDQTSGRVPNYGPNDGALVLQLTSCYYLDYRPIIQSAHYLIHGTTVLDDGPWNEESLWLFGPQALETQKSGRSPESSKYDTGGYYTLRGRESWGMIRCHTYKERPPQSDMLHFDLWWRGHNVLRDGGSYHYFCPKPWNNYFDFTRAHNTVEIDGLDQMVKGPRFLWLDWTTSRFREYARKEAGRIESWEGEHYGYKARCGVTHRRRIERIGETAWTVKDDLLGLGRHDFVLYWRLGDWPYTWDSGKGELRQETPAGIFQLCVQSENCEQREADIIRGFEDNKTVQGWESLYYGEKAAVPVLRLAVSGTCPVSFVTQIGLGVSADAQKKLESH